MLIWGLSDNNSWIPTYFTGCGNATLHDASYQPKPAYYGVQDGLNAIGSGGGSNKIYKVRARVTKGAERMELRVNYINKYLDAYYFHG